MTLAHVELTSGRVVRLHEARMRSTYDGLLEGYPCRRLNEMVLKGVDRMAGGTWPGRPVHVVPPVPTRPYGDSVEGWAFGPVETLPKVIVVGHFSSDPVDPELDAVLHTSRLVVAWFQDDAVLPTGRAAAAALREVDWDAYARDDEL